MHKLADRLVFALDKPGTFKNASAKMRALRGLVGIVKINSAFTRWHKKIVSRIHALGFDCWVDLKFHDVPRTVEEHILALRELGVKYCTIHLCGGAEMIKLALDAATRELRDPNDENKLLAPITIIGVTLLTSINDAALAEQLTIYRDAKGLVRAWAKLGKEHAVTHFVCSPNEAEMLREELGEEAIIITPGVRFAGSDVQDQKRVATPGNATRWGANKLVMGTELINGGAKAAKQALAEVEEALAIAA